MAAKTAKRYITPKRQEEITNEKINCTFTRAHAYHDKLRRLLRKGRRDLG